MANFNELLPYVKRFLRISGDTHFGRRVAWVRYADNHYNTEFRNGGQTNIGLIFCDETKQHIYSTESDCLYKRRAHGVGWRSRKPYSYSRVVAMMPPLKKEEGETPIALLRTPTEEEKSGKWTDKKSKEADYNNKEWTLVSP